MDVATPHALLHAQEDRVIASNIMRVHPMKALLASTQPTYDVATDCCSQICICVCAISMTGAHLGRTREQLSDSFENQVLYRPGGKTAPSGKFINKYFCLFEKAL